MFSRKKTSESIPSFSELLDSLASALQDADAVVLGAGAGLSTAAGFVYTGERFDRYFSDFAARYGFHDMYSGGFYPYATLEEFWAYWSRYIFINRFVDAPIPVHSQLLELLRDRDYFVLTTNVDHCFQKAGFDKNRLFYTQGDYGLVQCVAPCHRETYDDEDFIRQMVEAQGFEIADGEDGEDGTGPDLVIPEGVTPSMSIPSELLPVCPRCGRPLTTNLRADSSFVEDSGWHRASARYDDFMRRHRGMHVLYLEIGVGGNTPGIIKYPFWRMVHNNPDAVYACVNYGEAVAPMEIEDRSICIDADAADVVAGLLERVA